MTNGMILVIAWLSLGVAADLLMMCIFTAKRKRNAIEFEAEFRAKNDYYGPLSKREDTTIKDQILEAPWWAHVIMISMPFSILLFEGES